jgi:hypothetical protein
MEFCALPFTATIGNDKSFRQRSVLLIKTKSYD